MQQGSLITPITTPNERDIEAAKFWDVPMPIKGEIYVCSGVRTISGVNVLGIEEFGGQLNYLAKGFKEIQPPMNLEQLMTEKKKNQMTSKYANYISTEEELTEDLNIDRTRIKCMLKALNSSKFITGSKGAAIKCGIGDRVFIRWMDDYKISKTKEGIWISDIAQLKENKIEYANRR